MAIHRTTVFVVCTLYGGILLSLFFLSDATVARFLLAGLSAVTALGLGFLLKKKKAAAIEHATVALLTGACCLGAVMICYLSGLSFGFVRTLVPPNRFLRYLLPYGITVVCSERIRRILLMQENFPVTGISYLLLLMSYVRMLSEGRNFASFASMQIFMGSILFPAITANILCHFLSFRYGTAPGTLYFLILTCYPLLIPVRPDVPGAMQAFGRVAFPLLLLGFFLLLYSRPGKTSARRRVWLRRMGGGFSVFVLSLAVLLISCRFRFGMLVIGSESMTGAVNMGDAVIFEAYDGQSIQPGDILIFKKNGMTVVHRVIEIHNIDGQIRYYTKGDANEEADPGYVTGSDIVGVTVLKIAGIGYPTLWLKGLFQ